MKDPANAVLKAYVDILKNAIVVDGNTIYAGTGIPKDTTEWVLIYIESIEFLRTGNSVVIEALVALEVVSMQEILESNDIIVNEIVEQVLGLIDNKDAFQMNGLELVDLRPMNFTRDEQTTETNHIITRKLQVFNHIQQI